MATFPKLEQMYTAAHDDRGIHQDAAERLRLVSKNTSLLLEYIGHLERKAHASDDAYNRAKEDLAGARGRRETLERQLTEARTRNSRLERAIVEMALQFTPPQY